MCTVPMSELTCAGVLAISALYALLGPAAAGCWVKQILGCACNSWQVVLHVHGAYVITQ